MPLFKLQITFAIVTTIHADSVCISKRHSWIHIHNKRCLVSVVSKCCLAFSHSLLCCQCTLSSKNHIKYILCEVLSTSEIDNPNEKTLYCQLQDIAHILVHTYVYYGRRFETLNGIFYCRMALCHLQEKRKHPDYRTQRKNNEFSNCAT